MAKLSSINKNNKRIKLSNKFYKKRFALKKIIMDKKISLEERFSAQQKLSKLPRNSLKKCLCATWAVQRHLWGSKSGPRGGYPPQNPPKIG